MTAILEPTGSLFRSSLNISTETRGQIVELLNRRLADSSDLKLHAKHAHWNVKGKELFLLHQFFDAIAGHCVPSYDSDAVLGEQHIHALAKGIASFAAQVRTGIDLAEKLGDKAIADLRTEIPRQADKDLWFLEAHLQP